MTTILFTNVHLVDPEAGNVVLGTLLVKDGVIADHGQELAVPDGAQVVDGQGKYLAPGIVDIGVKVCEPG